MAKDKEERSSWRVDEGTVEHISDLVNIGLSKEEVSLFAQQLNEILDYFRRIDEVNTRNIEPTFHVMDIKDIVRDDTTSPCLPNKIALENASKKENGLFKAPRIL
ncbi:MAG: Asp-tRNA(Asn)/Glu-tRNA(Gln) amidotransferase subunit GatC [Candidatus Bathyarchaeota archaeon]|nr:MAG: Asp-tRNA(Asn)/Glu-tRNA(Gln) amidotransferase subunit GatC [Candidatus Bathyarchaeota archaeon]